MNGEGVKSNFKAVVSAAYLLTELVKKGISGADS